MGNICVKPADMPLPPGLSTPPSDAGPASPSPTLPHRSDTPLRPRRPPDAAQTQPSALPLSASKAAYLTHARTPERLTIQQVHGVSQQYAKKLDTEIGTNVAKCTPQEAATALAGLSAEAGRKGQPLAYLYASNRRGPVNAIGVDRGLGHVDTYIATPNGRVLNLVGYDSPSDMWVAHHLASSGTSLATLDLSQFMQQAGGAAAPKRVNLQAGMTECGSLGLSVMKEYLKDGAHQLDAHCLVLRTGGQSDRWSDLMIPSPQALRYSQSSLAIKVARAVVEGEEPTNTVEHGGKTFQVATLVGKVREGVRCEKALDAPGAGPGMDEAALVAFRQQWCRALDEVLPQREAMTAMQDGQQRNLYLSQVVDRHHRKSPLPDN